MVTGCTRGGVGDSEFNFIAGLHRSAASSPVNRDCVSAYAADREDLEVRDESVIFGGVIMRHFGHMLCDGTSRLWYPATHPQDRRKVVFVMYPEETEPYYEILELAGIPRERVEVISKPTQFAEVTIPGETVHSLGTCGYKKEWQDLISRMRQNVTPSPYKKIYYTRSKFENSGCVGEEYFDAFFAANGFKVVSPELLPFKEQVALMAGADEVATIMGTTAIQSIFTKPGTRFTVLNRSKSMVKSVILSLHAAQSTAFLVDVYKNFLPEQQAGRCVYLLAPTPHWHAYLKQQGLHGAENLEYPEKDNIYRYLLAWGERYKSEAGFQWIKNETVPDIARRINKYFFDRNVDTARFPLPEKWRSKTRTNERLIRDVASLEEQLLYARSQGQSLGCASVSCFENTLYIEVPLHCLSREMGKTTATFRLHVPAETTPAAKIPAEIKPIGKGGGLFASCQIGADSLCALCSDNEIAGLCMTIELVGESSILELPVTLSPEKGPRLFVMRRDNKTYAVCFPDKMSASEVFVRIALLSVWMKIPAECRISHFDWDANKANFTGTLNHPLARMPEAQMHLVEKGNPESAYLVRMHITGGHGATLDWKLELDPIGMYKHSAFEKIIFDFDFDIEGINQRANFGYRRPVGTMKLLKAVQPKMGDDSFAIIEDKDRSLGLEHHSSK